MDDRKSQPLFVVLLLALVGMFTLPRGLSPDNSSSKSAAPKAAAAANPANQPTTTAPQALENPDLAILGPLFYLTNDGSTPRVMDRAKRPQFDRVGRQDLVQQICDRTRLRSGSIQAMIALLPDPVRTSASQDFDSHVDSIMCAAEAAGFVLALHRFPWDELDKSDRSQGVEWRSLMLKPPQPDVEHTVYPWTPRWYDLPGLLVFRKDETLLVMFLVLETPTRGLRKHQFNWSLDLLDALADAQPRNAGKRADRSFHVLGPKYTGTAESLNQAIDGWLTHARAERLLHDDPIPPVFKRSYRFSIAASASEIDAGKMKNLPLVKSIIWDAADLDYLLVLPEPKPSHIEFRSASNRRREVTERMSEFLQEQLGEGRLAMLVESNTGLGRSLSQPEDRIHHYAYPLHIASLRQLRKAGSAHRWGRPGLSLGGSSGARSRGERGAGSTWCRPRRRTFRLASTSW